MITFNRHEFPPGGFIYYQAQTGYWLPTPVSSTFDQSVDLIIKHRQKNPAVTAKYNLSLDWNTVANELETYTKLRLGIPLNAAPNFQAAPRTMPQVVEQGVVAVKKLASGAALLFDWEESGQPPVTNDVANQRASVCAGCPKNDPQHLSKYFTQPVSDMLKKKLARLYAMNLTTPDDAKLGICSACLCPLKLKVFCGLDLILKHLRPEAKAELDPRCWITKS